MNSTAPVALSNGVYWLGAHRDHAYLQCNTYAVLRDGAVLVIDPGPDILFPDNHAGLSKITNTASVTGMVLTQSSFDAVSSLPRWTESGVTAAVYAHWWAALTIRLSGHSGETVHLHPSNVTQVHPLPGIEFQLLPNLSDHGMLCVFDRPSGILFTGDLFGYPEGGSASLVDRVNGYNRRLLHNPDTRNAVRDCIETLGVRVLCPQHGDVIDLEGVDIDRWFSGYSGSDAVATVEPADELERELESLRKQNTELMESVVLANDARIKDAATGFYNETFLQEVLPTLISPDRPAAVALIVVDESVAGSRSTSPSLQEQTMRALATEIINAAIPGALVFRFRGHSCVVVLPGQTIPETREPVQELVNRVRESDVFPQATTVSVGIADTDQLQRIRTVRRDVDPVRTILGGMIVLLDQLENDGDETYIEVGATSSPEEMGRSGEALLVTSDPLLAESLAALLDVRGIPSRRVDNGGDAVVAATLSTEGRSAPRPEIIITELSVPQLDGFQLRQTLLDDPGTREIPVLLILDYKTVDTVKRALALGIEHTFPKPLDLNEIAGVCELVLQRGPG